MHDGQSLEGRVAIVTGAARGQGAADARRLCAAGAFVVVTDLLEEEGRALCEEIGNAAVFVRHDVSKQEDWDVVVATCRDARGRLDILVNNAGIHHSTPLREESVEQFEKVLSVNLIGPFLGIRAVTELMQRSGGGSIINIASTAAASGFPGHAAYGASKWGLRGLSKVAAAELGPLRIRVNTILPGAINTAMMTPIKAGQENRFASLPLGRHGEPDEIATVVLFLASDASTYVSGAEIAVDGGALINGTPPLPRSAK